MIIPRSQQARAVSQPSLQQHTPLTGLSSIGNAVGGVMNAVDEKQRENEANQKKIALIHDQVAEREAKVKVDDVLTTEMSDQVTQLKNGLSNGTYNAQTGSETFKKWSDERYKQLENDLPLHARENFKSYWNDNVNRQTSSFLPLQLRADAQKDLQLVDQAFDIATRYDEAKGEEYLESFLISANLPEAEKSSQRQKYKTTRNVMSIDSRITNAVGSKNIEDLTALVTDLDSGKYGHIDGPTAQQKKSQALSRIDALNKQTEVEENKRQQVAGKVFNDFKTQALTGRDLDDEYKANVRASVKGTEHEGEAEFYIQQSANFQSFGRKSTSQQLALINEQKTKMKNSKTNDAVTEEKVLGVYESLYQEKLSTLKENPNQAVRESGLKVNELSSIELKTDPKSWAEKAVDNGINQLSLKDANVKLKPISTEDLPEAKKAFDAMGVNDKLNFIGQLVGQSKGVANGHKIWGATLGQLGGGDQSYIMAGISRMHGFQSDRGEDVATAIISGTQALKNKQLTMPKDELLKQEFNKYVGNSVSGETANMTYSGFKSIYAHLSERDGYLHKDKDDLNKDIAGTALSMATGGVYSQDIKYGNQKSWKVSKPYGMSDSPFESTVSSGLSYISSKTGISVADLETLRLRRSSKRSAKNEIQYDLINERGNPLVVNGVEWRVNMTGRTK